MDQNILNCAKRVELKDKEFLTIDYPNNQYHKSKREAEGEIKVNERLKLTRLEDGKYLIDFSLEEKYVVLRDDKGEILSLADEVTSILKDVIERETGAIVSDVDKDSVKYIFKLEGKAKKHGILDINIQIKGQDLSFKIHIYKGNTAEISYGDYNEIYFWKIKEKYSEVT